jgi:hypothetical protein
VDEEGTIPVRVEAEEEEKGAPRKFPTTISQRVRAPTEKSMHLLSSGGTLEK